MPVFMVSTFDYNSLPIKSCQVPSSWCSKELLKAPPALRSIPIIKAIPQPTPALPAVLAPQLLGYSLLDKNPGFARQGLLGSLLLHLVFLNNKTEAGITGPLILDYQV